MSDDGAAGGDAAAAARDDAAQPLPELDPVIHAQGRLRVMSVLAALEDGDQLAFPRLQELVDMTAGNLSTHVRKLEDAGYVTVAKAFKGRTPVTWVALTDEGRWAFRRYTRALRRYLASADGAG